MLWIETERVSFLIWFCLVAWLVDLYIWMCVVRMHFFYVGWQSEICDGKTGVATHLFIEWFGYGDQIHCRSHCWQAAAAAAAALA